MIRIRLQGRLGNQLFQYAFALYASQKLKTKFVIEIRQKDGYQLGYFNLPTPLKFLSLGKLAQRFYNLVQRNFKTKKTFFVPGWDEDWSNRTLTDSTEYKGYFQDARFSYAVKEQLYNQLTIRDKYTKQFEEQFPFVFTERYAVLHIRFGDYENQTIQIKNNKFNWSLPLGWYYHSIKYASLGNMKLVVISDNMTMARERFQNTAENIFFPEGDAITHFQFLLHAEVCIVSNSSFAWWGAFLNQKLNKKVIAPANWVGYNAGFEFPKGIMTKEFEWIH